MTQLTKSVDAGFTPGPWRWEFNAKSKRVQLCGGVPAFDLSVMDFARFGMGGAAPCFVSRPRPGVEIMERCDKFAVPVTGRERHLACHRTPLTSWDDLADQIGGQYGERVKLDGEGEFSVDAAMKVIAEGDFIAPASSEAMPGDADALLAHLFGKPLAEAA